MTTKSQPACMEQCLRRARSPQQSRAQTAGDAPRPARTAGLISVSVATPPSPVPRPDVVGSKRVRSGRGLDLSVAPVPTEPRVSTIVEQKTSRTRVRVVSVSVFAVAARGHSCGRTDSGSLEAQRLQQLPRSRPSRAAACQEILWARARPSRTAACQGTLWARVSQAGRPFRYVARLLWSLAQPKARWEAQSRTSWQRRARI